MTLHSLTAATAALRSGQVTSSRLVDKALERIADEGGEGGRAFREVYAGDARREAARADRIFAAGGDGSPPLRGLPISIKDLFDIKGRPTTAGSVILKHAQPAAADAEIVRRLRCAGAIILGRTNMTEFAFSGVGLNPHHGTPRNPYDRGTGRIPGGSSSGAAVSVSDDMCFGAIGTDTGGSVRIPAALCGLVGFKPSQHRVPLQGAFPLSPTLDSIGPIARVMDDCILLDRVLSGEGAKVRESDINGLRFAVPTTYVLNDLDEAVAAAFFGALQRLSAAGASITELAIPSLAEFPAINARGTFPGIEGYAVHRDMLAKCSDGYDPRVRARLAAGGRFGDGALDELCAARARITEAVAAAGQPYDAFLMPTTPRIAPAIADLKDDQTYAQINLLMLRNPTTVNFVDGCAATVPCHQAGSAPVGLMIAGLKGMDDRILSISRAVEAVLRS